MAICGFVPQQCTNNSFFLNIRSTAIVSSTFDQQHLFSQHDINSNCFLINGSTAVVSSTMYQQQMFPQHWINNSCFFNIGSTFHLAEYLASCRRLKQPSVIQYRERETKMRQNSNDNNRVDGVGEKSKWPTLEEAVAQLWNDHG